MTSYQSTRFQSSHEDCGPSVGQLTPRPPDLSATLRDNSELAEAVAQCVVHDTASQGKALWHTEPRVMFKGGEESNYATQQGLSRDTGARCGADYGKKFDDCSVVYRDSEQLETGPSYRNYDDFCSAEPAGYFSRVNSDGCAYPLNASVVPSFDDRPPHRSDDPPWENCPQVQTYIGGRPVGDDNTVQAELTGDSRSQFVHNVRYQGGRHQSLVRQEPNAVQTGGECEAFGHSRESGRPKGRFAESQSQLS